METMDNSTIIISESETVDVGKDEGSEKSTFRFSKSDGEHFAILVLLCILLCFCGCCLIKAVR